MKCEKDLANLADQLMVVDIKGFTTAIVVRQLADQQWRTWRTGFAKLTAGK